jgi:L,D-transpeptidase catalytic domain
MRELACAWAIGAALCLLPVGGASAHAHLWGITRIRSLDPPPAAVSGAGETAAVRHADRELSNERTFTRWAYVERTAWIYAAPRGLAPRVGQLTWTTQDGFPAVYLVLRAHWDAHGREWVKLRIPGRPNGRTGWVRRGALGPFQLTHLLIVVDRERLRMYLYFWDRLVWSAPVGVGKPSSPTPAGHFWINERFKIEDPGSGYYPYAFGTTDYSTLTDWPGGGVVGIHGPYYAAQSIPGHISHGCIRLEVGDDFWLAAHVGLGTPVHVV